MGKMKGKTVVVKNFDMTTCIGIDDVVKLDMGDGFSIEMIMKISEACLQRDAELFKSEILDGNKNLLNPDAPAID